MILLTAYQTRMTLYALILCLAGILICYMIHRRKFYRRNIAGLQQFKNYHTALLTIIVEHLFNLLGWLMILLAVILYVIH